MHILSFSGFVPEQICDTERFIRYDGAAGISHYCGYAADFISRVLDDPRVDGAVFPKSCDSARAMAGYLDGCGKFLFQMHIPARQDDLAADMLRSTVLEYKRAVERHYGVTIPDSEVARRAVLVNERNRELAALYEELERIPYKAYLDMIHGLLGRPLAEQSVREAAGGLPVSGAGGKRVFLIGSLLCDTGIAGAIEDAGIKIVGDRLTESGRLFSVPDVETDGDLYGSIAASILGGRLSPTQGNLRKISEEDAEEVRRRGARGVIFVTRKYCEAYDYLFSVYRGEMEGQGIPVLRLSLSGPGDTGDPGSVLEAFADIL